MTYFVSLRLTAIVLGVIYIALHLPAGVAPAALADWSRRLVRNRVLGVVLMLLATLWFIVVTGVMDLGEISNLRVDLIAVWAIAGVLMAVFVPGLLVLRGLGCLLLMGAALLLDATFLVQTPWRYVVTLLAYGWVIKGIVLVYSPHIGRNWLDWAIASENRLRILGWAGAVFGLVLIILGIWVYPSSPNYLL